MREYPYIDETNRGRDMITVFGGYNHKPDCAEGEWYEQSGLTSDLYPVLSTRKKRAVCDVGTNVTGMIFKDKVYVCKGDGLYAEDVEKGESHKVYGITLDPMTEKHMVGMGARIYIFPDKVWYDTVKDTYGKMEFSVSSTDSLDASTWDAPESPETAGMVNFSLTYGDDGRTAYEHLVTDEKYEFLSTPPTTMKEKTFWYERGDVITATDSKGKTFNCVPQAVKWYVDKTVHQATLGVNMGISGAATDYSSEISDDGEYVKLVIPSRSFTMQGETVNQKVEDIMKALGLDKMCSKEHGSTLWEGTEDMDVYFCYLRAKRVTYLDQKRGKRLYFPDWHTTNMCIPNCAALFVCGIERLTPDMAYVVEHNNRLWGCSKDGHEIYASMLGNGVNWKTYQGIATDSYSATVGSDGAFTGATVYGDNPIFFKRDRMLKVFVSPTGAHQYKETQCKGVQEGSSRSIVNVNNMLIYKSDSEIVAYNGSIPFSISDKFGDVFYHDASAGRYRDKYFVSMKDESDKPHMFSYDTKTNLWMHEGNIDAKYLTTYDNNLLYWNGGVLTLTDGSRSIENETALAIEKDIDWFCESGTIGYASPDAKYVARLSVRFQLALRARMSFYISYDDGEWEHVFNLNGQGLRSFTIPITPRRCDHFRYKIAGHGDVKIFSISKTIEEGSDVT